MATRFLNFEESPGVESPLANGSKGPFLDRIGDANIHVGFKQNFFHPKIFKYDHVVIETRRSPAAFVGVVLHTRASRRDAELRVPPASRIKPICDRLRLCETSWLLSVLVLLSSVPLPHPASLPHPMSASSSTRPTQPPSAPASVSMAPNSPCSSSSSTTPPTHLAINAKHSP